MIAERVVGRRGFLRALGIGGAAAVLGRGLMGCQGPAKAEPVAAASKAQLKYSMHFQAKVTAYDLAQSTIGFEVMEILSAWDNEGRKKLDNAKALEVLNEIRYFKANEAMLNELQNNQDVRSGERPIFLEFDVSQRPSGFIAAAYEVEVTSFKIYNDNLGQIVNVPSPIVESPQ